MVLAGAAGFDDGRGSAGGVIGCVEGADGPAIGVVLGLGEAISYYYDILRA